MLIQGRRPESGELVWAKAHLGYALPQGGRFILTYSYDCNTDYGTQPEYVLSSAYDQSELYTTQGGCQARAGGPSPAGPPPLPSRAGKKPDGRGIPPHRQNRQKEPPAAWQGAFSFGRRPYRPRHRPTARPSICTSFMASPILMMDS